MSSGYELCPVNRLPNLKSSRKNSNKFVKIEKNTGGATSLQELKKLPIEKIMIINAFVVQIFELLYQIIHYYVGYLKEPGNSKNVGSSSQVIRFWVQWI